MNAPGKAAWPWLARACDGAVAVEFAIVGTALIVLFLGVIEFGWVLWYQSTLQQAVEATARYCSIVNSSGSPCTSGNIQATGASYLLGVNFSPTFTLPTPTCVSGSFTFATIIPGIPDLTGNAQSCYPATP